MDKVVMIEWVENVLRPYLLLAPPGIIPILFFDLFCCHIMAEVVTQITNLGCEVRIIPGGCTRLVQPVDVGANKPFELCLCKYCEEWMLQKGLAAAAADDQSKVPPPTCDLITKWCSAAYKSVPTQALHNAWRRTGILPGFRLHVLLVLMIGLTLLLTTKNIEVTKVRLLYVFCFLEDGLLL